LFMFSFVSAWTLASLVCPRTKASNFFCTSKAKSSNSSLCDVMNFPFCFVRCSVCLLPHLQQEEATGRGILLQEQFVPQPDLSCSTPFRLHSTFGS
jgi:hypothetical protein